MAISSPIAQITPISRITPSPTGIISPAGYRTGETPQTTPSPTVSPITGPVTPGASQNITTFPGYSQFAGEKNKDRPTPIITPTPEEENCGFGGGPNENIWYTDEANVENAYHHGFTMCSPYCVIPAKPPWTTVSAQVFKCSKPEEKPKGDEPKTEEPKTEEPGTHEPEPNEQPQEQPNEPEPKEPKEPETSKSPNVISPSPTPVCKPGTRGPITDSVGNGGINKPEDVCKVQCRLNELRFKWIPCTDKVSGDLAYTISLFRAITKGEQKMDTASKTGTITPGSLEERWLWSSNAPRWDTLPGRGTGFVNDDTKQGYGTDWLVSVINDAGSAYTSTYKSKYPKAPDIHLNAASIAKGGPSGHKGHHTGLSCDVRLPMKNGGVGGFWCDSPVEYKTSSGNTLWKCSNGASSKDNPNYDRDAARAMILSVRNAAQKNNFQITVYFNDPKLIKDGLCKESPGHDHHFHFEIRPNFGP